MHTNINTVLIIVMPCLCLRLGFLHNAIAIVKITTASNTKMTARTDFNISVCGSVTIILFHIFSNFNLAMKALIKQHLRLQYQFVITIFSYQ